MIPRHVNAATVVAKKGLLSRSRKSDHVQHWWKRFRSIRKEQYVEIKLVLLCHRFNKALVD
jgi:hypothetical protein